MDKLKLSYQPNIGEAVSKEELKRILGEDKSSQFISIKLGCDGLNIGDKCYYKRNNEIYSGTCKAMPFAGIICWGG